MSGRGKYRNHRNRNQQSLSSVARETAASLPPDSPVLALFKSIAVNLNDRHDRHERLVKLSRDITIESKRIIFLLHSAITNDSTEKAVREANDRFQKLIEGPFRNIGLELEKRPAYLHSRAITAGFQEFIEARTLCSLIDKKQIISWTDVQKQLCYKIIEKDDETEEVSVRTVQTMLPQTDYMLGLADLTGELMRRALNSISSGESTECFHSCQVVRDLYTGFLGLSNAGRELSRKLSTTRSNVSKVETAMYALRIRGGEMPPTLLVPAPQPWENGTHLSDDEGYY